MRPPGRVHYLRVSAQPEEEEVTTCCWNSIDYIGSYDIGSPGDAWSRLVTLGHDWSCWSKWLAITDGQLHEKTEYSSRVASIFPYLAKNRREDYIVFSGPNDVIAGTVNLKTCSS